MIYNWVTFKQIIINNGIIMCVRNFGKTRNYQIV